MGIGTASKLMSVYFAGKCTQGHYDVSAWSGEIQCSWRGELLRISEIPEIGQVFQFGERGALSYGGPVVNLNLDECSSCHGSCSCGNSTNRHETVKRCLSQIQACDAVFAFIERTDAYATLFELGFAHSLGKPIFLQFAPGGGDFREWWFTDIACRGQYRQWPGEIPDVLLFATTLKTMPYKDYLQTSHWKKMRLRALKAAGNRCQLCNTSGLLDVHHRTYERRGAEHMSDLTVLCRACHTKHHAKKR